MYQMTNCDGERAFSTAYHETKFRGQLACGMPVNLISCKLIQFVDAGCCDLESSEKLAKSAKHDK